MKLSIALYSGLVIFSSACTPCRQVEIESYPPGAAISVLSSSGFGCLELPPPESWSLLGYTPLTVSGCRLNNEIKAGWAGREIFLPEYHGSKRVRFDFEKENVREEDCQRGRNPRNNIGLKAK